MLAVFPHPPLLGSSARMNRRSAGSQPCEVQAHLLSVLNPLGKGKVICVPGLPCLSQKQAGFLQARLGEPTVTEMECSRGSWQLWGGTLGANRGASW